MPIPSKHPNIGRSQSWDAAGWYEGNWESENAFEYQRPLGRRSSLTYGGEGGWYEPPRANEIILQGGAELKQEAYPYQDAAFAPGPLRKGSVPDFTYCDRPAPMAGRGSLPPQDYYSDPSLSARSPKDPRCYRDHVAGRPLASYGAPGSRLSWDQTLGRPPAPPDTTRLYRDPKLVLDGQRMRGRDVSPAWYGTEPPGPRYAAEPPTFPSRPGYTDGAERPPEAPGARQAAPTCLVVDPTSTAGSSYGPGRESAGTKGPYDGYEAAVPTPSHPPVPPTFPGPEGKRSFDPEFVALLRAEGVSESTFAALLQQGFDSPNLLAMMEENDIKSVAPNLGQARVLSRIAHNYKAEMQLQRQERRAGTLRPRTRSNSFSHRSELPGDYGAPLMAGPTTDGPATSQHPPPLQPLSPRGVEMHRRPSSAPTQHLLETTTYPAPVGAPPGPHFLPGSGYNTPLPCSTRPASAYSAPAGMAMTAANPHPSPKTAYPTTYTVPMELMKRERTVAAAASPAPSPHSSPQLLRRPGAPGDGGLAPTAPAFPAQVSPFPKLSRRTGPPVIVSTMASPEPSNY
ncbi:C-terminal-binding protein 2 [Pitangus sulphuratus]|nr:C-terminal-binding protein 2 [Pitangus sulphuratus]